MPLKDIEARRAYQKRRYEAQKARIVSVVTAWQKRNPKKRAEYKRRWRAANRARENAKALAYARSYRGLPRPTRECPAACEVCGAVDKRALHLDHDHLTGEFRGWLCNRCNRALGFVDDRPDILRGLAAYLERSR